MAYQGYLSLGGNEVVNNSRAKGYVATADCAAPWLVGPSCDGLAAALGDSEYTYGEIRSAPWYDPDIDDISTRFLGVYAVSIEGLNDSTKTASMTEGIADGGRLGRSRRTSRSVRVRAVLSARGQDALEYGKSWLDSVLDGRACSDSAGLACGVGDVQFFSTCPPERTDVYEYTPWSVAATNVFTSPGFDDPSVIPVGAYQADDWSLTSGGHSLLVPPSETAEWNVSVDPESGLSPITPDGQDIVGSGYGAQLYGLGDETRLVETSIPGLYEMP